jgi:hypothetical protein
MNNISNIMDVKHIHKLWGLKTNDIPNSSNAQHKFAS